MCPVPWPNPLSLGKSDVSSLLHGKTVSAFFFSKHYLSADFMPGNLVGTGNKEINKTQGLLSRASKVVMEKGPMGLSAMEQDILDQLEEKSFTRPWQSALPTAL